MDHLTVPAVGTLHDALPRLWPGWRAWARSRPVSQALRLAYLPFLAGWERAQYRKAAHWVTHVDALGARAWRFVGPERVTVLPMPAPSGHTLWTLADSTDNLLVTPGFIKEHKGYADFLDVLAALPDCQWVLAGGPQDDRDHRFLERFLRTARLKGVSDRITVTGYLKIEDLQRRIMAARIALFPFRSGTGSASIAWAIALGLPVLGSDLAPIRQFKSHGAGLALMPTRDPLHCADLLKRLLDSPAELTRMSADNVNYLPPAARLYAPRQPHGRPVRCHVPGRFVRETTQRKQPGMRVLVDTRTSIGGIARYARTLVASLPATGPQIEVITFGRGSLTCGAPRARAVRPGLGRTILRRLLGTPKRIFDDQLGIPFAMQRRAAHVFHATAGFMPVGMCRPTILTCHDLSALDHPEERPLRLRTTYERYLLLYGLRRAAHVIVGSRHVQRQIEDRLHLDPRRITCIYDPVLPLPAPDPATPRRCDLPARYFLTVGTLEPRKNLPALIGAQAEAYRATGVPLLLAGPYGWRQPALLDQIRSSGGAVRWLDFVPDAALAWLYSHALALVQYSLDEGFDYPVAEAMATGTPLILSDIPVHREVAADLAVYAPADDPPRLTALLRQAATRVVRTTHAAMRCASAST